MIIDKNLSNFFIMCFVVALMSLLICDKIFVNKTGNKEMRNGIYSQNKGNFPRFLFCYNNSFLPKNLNDSVYFPNISCRFVATSFGDTTSYKPFIFNKNEMFLYDSVWISNSSHCEMHNCSIFDLRIINDKLTFDKYYPDSIFQNAPINLKEPYIEWISLGLSNIFEQKGTEIIKKSKQGLDDDAFFVRVFKKGVIKTLFVSRKELDVYEHLLYDLSQSIIHNIEKTKNQNITACNLFVRDTFNVYVQKNGFGRKLSPPIRFIPPVASSVPPTTD